MRTITVLQACFYIGHQAFACKGFMMLVVICMNYVGGHQCEYIPDLDVVQLQMRSVAIITMSLQFLNSKTLI